MRVVFYVDLPTLNNGKKLQSPQPVNLQTSTELLGSSPLTNLELKNALRAVTFSPKVAFASGGVRGREATAKAGIDLLQKCNNPNYFLQYDIENVTRKWQTTARVC